MTNTATRTATEASAIAALSVAVGFATGGAYLAAGIAGVIGLALLGAYEYLNLKMVSLDEDQIEQLSEVASDRLQEQLDNQFGSNDAPDPNRSDDSEQ